MASSFVGSARRNDHSFSTASASRYYPFGQANEPDTPETTESRSQVEWPRAGKLRNFHFRIASNARTTATLYGLRVNSADSAILVSVGSGLSGTFSDVSNDVTVAVGDLVCTVIRTSTGTGAIVRAAAISAEFDDDLGLVNVFTGMNRLVNTVISSASGLTRYATGCCEFAVGSSNTANERMVLKTAGDFTRMSVNVRTNARTTSSSVTLMHNNAASTITITIGAGLTGNFRDTAHTVAYVSGDDFSVRMVTQTEGGTATLQLDTFTICAVCDADEFDIFAVDSVNTTAESTADNFINVLGGFAPSASLNRDFVVPFDCTIKNMRAIIAQTANNRALTLQVNGVDSALTVAWLGADPNTFYTEDVTNSVSLVEGDVIRVKRAATTSTSVDNPTWVGFTIAVDLPPPADPSGGQVIFFMGS